MAEETASSDAVTKNQLHTELSISGGLMTGNLDMNNNRIYNVVQPDGHNQPATKIWSENKFLDKSSGVMAGPLNMSNNKITNLAKPTDDKDGVNKKYIDDNYLKLSGGTMTGHIILNNAVLTSQYQAISRSTGNAFFVQITNPYVYHQFNMVKNKIINLGDPTDPTDAINLKTLNKYNIKPSDHTNRFAYLMDPTNGLLQWTDLLTDSIALISIGDLNATSGNYHTYNKKVIFASIKKNSEGGYKWRLAIQCYRLQKDKEYTLCLEILTTDYKLWHKSVITVDTTTSQGVTVKNWHVNKYSHEYRTSSNQVKYMYYHKLLVTLSKTADSTPYFLHIQDVMAQSGIDLNTYPTNFNKYYLIAYGILGETMDLDPNKTYDYHTAFDIKPTEVVYNTTLDMNRKKILNIAPDKTKNNSAATVKMVKDLEAKLSPHTTNNGYRKIFEEFYDFGASNYQIVKGPSGIVVTGISPNITFPRIGIANIWEGGMRLTKTTISLQLFSEKSFTLCVVMQLWLNRAFSIKTLMSNGAHEKPHLIYDKTTKKLKLQTNGLRVGATNETSITLLNSFNGKRVVFWLTKKGTGVHEQ